MYRLCPNLDSFFILSVQQAHLAVCVQIDKYLRSQTNGVSDTFPLITVSLRAMNQHQ